MAYHVYVVVCSVVVFILSMVSLYGWISRTIASSHEGKPRSLAIVTLGFVTASCLVRLVEQILNLSGTVEHEAVVINIMFWLPISFATSALLILILFWAHITGQTFSVSTYVVFTPILQNVLLISNIVYYLILYSLIVTEAALQNNSKIIESLEIYRIATQTVCALALVGIFSFFGRTLHMEAQRISGTVYTTDTQTSKYRKITVVTIIVLCLELVGLIIVAAFVFSTGGTQAWSVMTCAFILKTFEIIGLLGIIFVFSLSQP